MHFRPKKAMKAMKATKAMKSKSLKQPRRSRQEIAKLDALLERAARQQETSRSRKLQSPTLLVAICAGNVDYMGESNLGRS